MATQPTQNPVPSESPRDLKFNAGKVDEFITSHGWTYTDRLGVKHYTIEGINYLAQQVMSVFGYVTLNDVTFTTGATVSNPNEVLFNTADNSYYKWTGSFASGAKVVPQNSIPESSGGVGAGKWINVGDSTLRGDLASGGGSSLVKYKGSTVESALDDRVKKSGDTMSGGLRIIGNGEGNLVVGNLPLPPGTDAIRDGVTVARLIQNAPTNCHGYADKTFIDNASDYGGYGVFDATVKLEGSNTHNHVYSFQDRTNYNGSGVLERMKGLFSSPTHSGKGHINERIAVYVNDVALSGAGSVVEQSGIYIEHLQAGNSNAAINVRQLSGLGYYSPFGGKMFQNGPAGFGVDPSSSLFPVNFRGDQLGTFYGFLTTDGNGMSMGVTGDNKIQFVAAGETRLQIKQAATFNRAITPGNDNSTPLGDMVNRWSTVYAGTGTINTSDGREKTEPLSVYELSKKINVENNPNVILDAWGDVSLIAFKWLSAIKEKDECARWHFGVIAQQVKESFDNHGVDGTIFGLLCYDEWGDQFDTIPAEFITHPDEFKDELQENEDGTTFTKKVLIKKSRIEIIKPERKVLVTPAGNRWGIRADQCMWLEAAYQRRERERMEERINKLEKLILKLN